MRNYPVSRARHIGAHHRKICPKSTRIAEISASDQRSCHRYWLRLEAHCTRPGLQADSSATYHLDLRLNRSQLWSGAYKGTSPARGKVRPTRSRICRGIHEICYLG
jgi:hypothetical protein